VVVRCGGHGEGSGTGNKQFISRAPPPSTNNLLRPPCPPSPHLVQLGRPLGSGLYHHTSSISSSAGASEGKERARSLRGRPTSPLVAQCSAISGSTTTLGAEAELLWPSLLLPLLGPAALMPLLLLLLDALRRSATLGHEPRNVSMARVRGLTNHSGSVVPVSICGVIVGGWRGLVHTCACVQAWGWRGCATQHSRQTNPTRHSPLSWPPSLPGVLSVQWPGSGRAVSVEHQTLEDQTTPWTHGPSCCRLEGLIEKKGGTWVGAG